MPIHPNLHTRVRRALSLLIGVLLWFPSLGAQGGDLSLPAEVAPATGAFITSIALPVPPLGGAEPDVALNYHSDSGRGYVGVGWSLQAASTIVRRGPQGAAPTWTARDKYYLDGAELVADASLGGTHRVRHGADFSRITFANGAWTITATDGTVSTFRVLCKVLGDVNRVYSWGLAKKQPSAGHAVAYQWEVVAQSTVLGHAAYLREINYGKIESQGDANGYFKVRLLSEAAPVPTRQAMGGGDMEHVGERLKTVVVYQNGAPVRAFTLAYETSPASGYFRLTSVTRRDGALTLSGTSATGGTASPPHLVQWEAGGGLGWEASGAYALSAADRTGLVKTVPWFTTTTTTNNWVAEVPVSFAGKSSWGDYLVGANNVLEMNPYGSVTASGPVQFSGGYGNDGSAYSGMVRRLWGDGGRLLFTKDDGITYQITLTNGRASGELNFGNIDGWYPSAIVGSGNQLLIEEYKSRTGGIDYRIRAGQTISLVGLENRSETITNTTTHLTGEIHGATGQWVDLNGDGIQDRVWSFWDDSGGWWGNLGWVRGARIYTATGWRDAPEYLLPAGAYTATSAERSGSGSAIGAGNVMWADLDGDGRIDYLVRSYDGPSASWTVRVGLNTGSGWRATTSFALPLDKLATGFRSENNVTHGPTFRLGYLNDDRLPDLLINLWDVPGGWFGDGGKISAAYLNTGAGWTVAPQFAIADDYADTAVSQYDATGNSVMDSGGLQVIDLNGDGLDDLFYRVFVANQAKWFQRVLLNTGSGWRDDTAYLAPDDRIATGFARSDGRRLGSTFSWTDLNGDGLPDLVLNMTVFEGGPYWGGTGTRSRAWLNTGSGWTEAPGYALSDPWAATSFGTGSTATEFSLSGPLVRFADLNGDGLVDAISRVFEDGVGWHRFLRLNTGNGWGPNLDTWPSDFTATGMVARPADRMRVFGGHTDFLDLDSDGRADTLTSVWDDNGWWWGDASLVNAVHLAKASADQVVRVQSPAGGAVRVDYQRQGRLPSAGALAPGLVPSARASRRVVATLTYEDGVGGQSPLSIGYANPRSSPSAQRDLAWASMSATNPFGGRVFFTYSDDPRLPLGTVVRTELRDAADAVLRTQTWDYKLESGTVQPALITRQTWSSVFNDGGGAETTTLTHTYADFTAQGRARTFTSRGTRLAGGVTTVDHHTLIKRTYPYDAPRHLVVLGSEETLDALPATPVRLAFSEYAYGGGVYGATTLTSPLLTRSRSWIASTSLAETQYRYDARGNLTGTTDPLGRVSSFGYDTILSVHPVSVTTPLMFTRRAVFDLTHGLVTEETDLNGQKTLHAYDPTGQHRTTTLPSGVVGHQTTETSFGVPGSHTVRVTQMPAGPAVWTEQVHDGLGRVILERRKDGLQRRLAYVGATGKVARESEWHAPAALATAVLWTTTTYDALGRPLVTTLPDNASFALSYEGANVIVRTLQGTDSLRRYDSRGLLVALIDTDAAGTTLVRTDYTYDAAGRLTYRNTPTARTGFSYDGLSQLTRRVDDDRGTEDFVYDQGGRLVTHTTATGAIITTTYDLDDRPLSDNQGNRWTYDAATLGKGLLSKEESAGGVRTITAYGWHGQATAHSQTILATTRSFTAAYDNYGRLTQANYPNSQSLSYTYDADNGRVEAVFDGASGSTTLWARFEEKPLERALLLRLGNGATQRFDYDPRSGAMTRAQAVINGVTLLDLAYRYDPARRLAASDEKVGLGALRKLTYGYDDWNRLTAFEGDATHGRMTWAYDPMGNPTRHTVALKSEKGFTATYTARKNRLATLTWANGTAWTVSHDSAGRLTTLGAWTYAWSPQGRLLSATSAAARATYGYDSTGQRLHETNTNSANQVTRTRYFGEWTEIEGQTPTLAIRAQGKLIGEKKGATRSFFLTDKLGSIRAVTDSAGTVTSTFDYLPFGERLATSGPNVDYGFTQHRMDDDTGLVYMGSRYYHPRLGRFLSPDLIDTDDQANTQTANPYAYVLNSPVNAVDPDGHFFFAFILGALSLLSNVAGIVGVIATVALSVGLSYAGLTTTAVGVQADFGGAYPTTVTAGVYSPNGDGSTTNIATFAHVTFNSVGTSGSTAAVPTGSFATSTGAGGSFTNTSAFSAWTDTGGAGTKDLTNAAKLNVVRGWSLDPNTRFSTTIRESRNAMEFVRDAVENMLDLKVTLYRGIRYTTETASPAWRNFGAARAYETLRGKNLDELLRRHAISSYDSPFVSATSNFNVARAYAGRKGFVLELRLPWRRVIFNPFQGGINLLPWQGEGRGRWVHDDEFLIPLLIAPNEIKRFHFP